MGSYYSGVPPELAEFARDRFGVEVFVETGTFKGATAALAAGIFKKVVTIELSEELHRKAARKYAHLGNVSFMQGDSVKLLKEVLRRLKPSLFWLDAHFSGGTTGGEHSSCPLLEEIGVILSSDAKHILLIDDARAITLPAPNSLPHDMPGQSEVYRALNANGGRYNVIWRDVIVSVSPEYATALYEGFFARQEDVVGIMSSLDALATIKRTTGFDGGKFVR